MALHYDSSRKCRPRPFFREITLAREVIIWPNGIKPLPSLYITRVFLVAISILLLPNLATDVLHSSCCKLRIVKFQRCQIAEAELGRIIYCCGRQRHDDGENVSYKARAYADESGASGSERLDISARTDWSAGSIKLLLECRRAPHLNTSPTVRHVMEELWHLISYAKRIVGCTHYSLLTVIKKEETLQPAWRRR
ncbi:hypothetical protein BC629DRAFT_1440180 [Irpex lacteus]|nr:hypothetical protein BC629DRAFT_1440180 [Irpex lacteus]